MTLFLQYTVNGLQNGAVYAALALSIVLIYRGSGIINFATGELAMFSTFVTWSLLHAGVPLGLAVLLAMAAAFLINAGVERVLIRPVPHDAHLAAVMITLGLALAVNAIAQKIWGTQVKSLPSLFPSSSYRLGGVTIEASAIGVLVLLTVVAGGFYVFFQHTKPGLAIRAVTSNRDSSQLAGVRVGHITMLAWGIAGAMGALAGALIVPLISAFDTNFMQSILVLGFAAATLGGLDSLKGAILGGLIVGVIESLASNYIGSDLGLTSAFVVILVVLLVRPSGLFGTRRAERV
jgi:branched-chain amino acid transport system permease protein